MFSELLMFHKQYKSGALLIGFKCNKLKKLKFRIPPVMDNTDRTTCDVCGLSFANYSNRIRHERKIHGMEAEPEPHDAESVHSEDSDSQPVIDKHHDIFGSLEESESGSDDEQEENMDAWKFVIHQVLDGITKLPQNINDLLKEPYLSCFVQRIKDKADEIIQTEKKLQFGEFYAALDKKREKLEDSEESHATKKAWKKTKDLLKQLIIDNFDIVKEYEEEMHTEENDAVDEDDEEEEEAEEEEEEKEEEEEDDDNDEEESLESSEA